jgi:hypothetical protein
MAGRIVKAAQALHEQAAHCRLLAAGALSVSLTDELARLAEILEEEASRLDSTTEDAALLDTPSNFRTLKIL